MKAKMAMFGVVVCVAAPACSGDGSSGPAVAAPQEGVTTAASAAVAVERADTRELGEHCGLPAGLGAVPGYSVRIWAQGTKTMTQPDPIEWVGDDVWVGFQNGAATDGSDGKSSTIVEYTKHGRIERTFDVLGHVDGVRFDPVTRLVWVSTNEDANPTLQSIDPSTGVVTPYTLAPTAHGGGYDDMAFVGGKFFMVASNPTLDASGNNTAPALVEVSISGNKAIVTPALMGNASAVDLTTGMTVTLNEIDPDSLSVGPSGQLVLVNQGGSEVVFIANPGTPTQSVTRVPVATQLDDTVFATAQEGELMIADGVANTIYTVRSQFVPGTVFTETPNDSSVPGMIGTVDLTTGFVTPKIIGLGKPTGLIFVAD
jgi:hypothetical protein